MRTALLGVVGALASSPVIAQPAACPACARGDELIAKLSLEPLREVARELAGPGFEAPLAPAQYARVVELRRRVPALVRAGALDDGDLAAVATALCRTLEGTCTEKTWRALLCLADRCEVALPPTAPSRADVLEVPSHCHGTTYRRIAPVGLGFDVGLGYHRSRHPSDGQATSVGIETRVRLARRVGAVARIDHVSGRDEATDADGDGADDMSTGSITRVGVLAGPSLIFAHDRLEEVGWRFVRLDVLGGYLSTRSQPDENGPAVGLDLSHQISIFRVGIRYIQGLGDASGASTIVGHVGVVAGASPRRDDEDDCSGATSRRHTRRRLDHSRLALGADYLLGGYGFSPDLGVIVPSIGAQLAWHLTRRADALARADFLLAPGYKRDRTFHQAVLAGLRLDLKRRDKETGWFSTVAGGYTHGSGIVTLATSGPIGEVGLGWGFQNEHGAAYFHLHGRFGLTPDNDEFRAIFLSGGFEVRLDPDRWSDRGRD